MIKDPYEEGRNCALAKRWCASRGIGDNNESLDKQIPHFDHWADVDKSQWFSKFYRGIANGLRATGASARP